MAVTIDEMNVIVQPTEKPAPSAPAPSGSGGKKAVDLQQALQALHVRQHRLKAD